MKTRSLLGKLSKRFPKRYAKMNHDYVGLMAGHLKDETNKILLCLDFDEKVFDVAKKYKPDLIITHHPFIYGPRGKVLKHDLDKRMLLNDVEANGLTIYSMHTNFDTGRDGMNDALSRALGLKNVYTPENNIMMRIGWLNEKMDIHDFAKYAKNKLNVNYGLLIAEGIDEVKKVAIIGGAGSREYVTALGENADIFISGDAPHHVRRSIVNSHYNYLDLPHEIEKIFMPQMKEILLDIDNSLDILIVDHEKEPEVI